MPTILIIDDYDMLRDVMKMVLDDLGLVHTARSGEEALGLMELVAPDVVITDMPGMEFIRQMHKIGSTDYDKDQKTNQYGEGNKPKIILYSAMMNRDLREQARELGVAVCLSKPFELEDMRETVQKFLSTDYAD